VHWLSGGSMVLTTVVPSERMHPNAPVSPAELNIDCPGSAICSKMVFSAFTVAAPASFSPTPQLELVVAAASWLAIAVHSSSSVWPV